MKTRNICTKMALSNLRYQIKPSITLVNKSTVKFESQICNFWIKQDVLDIILRNVTNKSWITFLQNTFLEQSHSNQPHAFS